MLNLLNIISIFTLDFFLIHKKSVADLWQRYHNQPPLKQWLIALEKENFSIQKQMKTFHLKNKVKCLSST